jgi:hypothetical protein
MNGDECAVGLNIINRSYTALLHPLDYMQVAPIGFLWSERFMYQYLGMSEYAMRLLPTLAGILALILFAYWARLLANPLASFIATAIVATGIFTVQHGVEVKPYGYDLLASLLMLLPATLFLRNGSVRSLIVLIAITPIALSISYPAVFIAGGVAVAITTQLRSIRPRFQALFLFYILVFAVSFFCITYRIGAGQYHGTTALMSQYWKDSFPPANPARLLLWLVSVHTGPMFACPIGGKNFLSTPNFLLFLLGVGTWRTTSKSSFLSLLLIPFLLSLLAAAFHRYPYGQSERVAQHLVPAIALLIGVGIASAIRSGIKTEPHRKVVAKITFALFLGLALYVAILNIRHPGTAEHIAARDSARNAIRAAGPHATIAVVMAEINTQVNTQWYLREANDHIIWNALENRAWQTSPDPICIVSSYPIPHLQQHLEQMLNRPAAAHLWWTVAPFGPPEHWDAYIFDLQR